MSAITVTRSNPSKPKFSTRKFFPNQEKKCDLFLKLFCGNSWGYIYRPLGDHGTWKTAKTFEGKKWSLKPSEVFKAIACVHPRFYFGTRAAHETRFANIDIDKKSQYHNKKHLDQILQMLQKAGIESVSLYRSSSSGGWHLYMYFDEFVPTRVLRTALVQLCLANGFKVVKGQLEIFPDAGSPGSEGFGMRLPLQSGFAWLDPETLEVIEEREELMPSEALHKLLCDVNDGNEYDSYRQLVDYAGRLYSDHKKIKDALAASFPNVIPLRLHATSIDDATADDIAVVIAIFGYIPPGMKVDRWTRGRDFTHTGLTDDGQRHLASMDLNHYYFYGDPSRGVPALGYSHEEMRRVLVDDDIHRRHNGFSREINRGTPVASLDIYRMAYWRPAHKKLTASVDVAQSNQRELPPAIIRIRANNKRMRHARTRITEAVARLLDQGTFLSKDAIAVEAKCSPVTAAKHADLWRHLQEQQWASRLTKDTGEFKGRLEVAEPQKAQPSSTAVLKAPPGLLAARQIAYELGMRNAQEERSKKKTSALSTQEFLTDWKESIQKELPESFKTADTLCLQFLQARFGVSLATSPDYESQRWLQEILEAIRIELKNRWVVPDVVSFDSTLESDRSFVSLLDTG